MKILGILNLTPDSFSDGGAFVAGDTVDVDRAVARARQLVVDGAEAIDIGGESTRPGSDAIPVELELARVVPVLERLASLDVPLSIDTRRAPVARAAFRLGATILNDTAALQDDPELAGAAAEAEVEVVLMHRRGVPKTMQQNVDYADLFAEVRDFFGRRIEFAIAAGIARERLTLDPGLGFGKTFDDSYRLVADIDRWRGGDDKTTDGGWTDLGLMIGASRKSFLSRFDARPAAERLPGSLAFAAAARLLNADWVRVHDVRETAAFLRTFEQAYPLREGAQRP